MAVRQVVGGLVKVFSLLLGAPLAVAAVAMTLIRLTVRDRFPWIATAYYALPWPAVAVLAVVAAALLWPWRWLRRAMLGVGALSLLCWLVPQPMWHAPGQAEPGDITLRFWNADGHEAEVLDEAEWAAASGIDIAIFAEAGVNRYTRYRNFPQRHPQYQSQLLSGFKYAVIRGTYKVGFNRWLPSRTSVNGLTAEVGGRTLRIVIADVGPDPLYPRGPNLQKIHDMAREFDADLVLGDFNTPVDSALLDPYRADYSYAFDSGGAWLRETWPRPLPLLGIDQVWAGPRLRIVRAERFFPPLSRHAGVAVTLRWVDM